MIHRGYEVWITDSSKHAIREYSSYVEDDDKTTITCYIPSVGGQEFEIHWQDRTADMHASIKVTVDDQYMGGKHCNPESKGSRMGIRTESVDVYRRFKFRAIQTTDDDDRVLSVPSPDKLGLIKVRVVQVHPPRGIASFQPRGFREIGTVHERSKKAGAHCVSLGAGVRLKNQPRRKVTTVPVGPKDEAYATFIFIYRPAEVLQAQGLMPLMPPKLKAQASVPRGIQNTQMAVPNAHRSLPAVTSEAGPRPPTKVEVGHSGLASSFSKGKRCLGMIDLTEEPDDFIVTKQRARDVDRKPVLGFRRVKREGPRPSSDIIDLTLD